MSVITEVLAPFEIWEVPFGQQTIKFREPLVLQPSYLPDDPEEPDENEYLSVKCPDLWIDVFAENRDELLDAVYACIQSDWKNVVQREDTQLNRDVLRYKRNYLDLAELVDE
ncbi:MAG: hypothetical protein ACRC10_11800 [Thermoguttaceae bacterium]